MEGNYNSVSCFTYEAISVVLVEFRFEITQGMLAYKTQNVKEINTQNNQTLELGFP